MASASPMYNLTELAALNRQGDREAGDKLYESIYLHLKKTAGALLRLETGSRTLTPTALVNESYLRMDIQNVAVESRQHLFHLAALAMKRILLDRGRRRQCAKRIDPSTVARILHPHNQAQLLKEEKLSLRGALEKLSQCDLLVAETVWLRFGEELTLDELAAKQGRAVWLIRRDSDFGLTWLARHLSRL